MLQIPKAETKTKNKKKTRQEGEGEKDDHHPSSSPLHAVQRGAGLTQPSPRRSRDRAVPSPKVSFRPSDEERNHLGQILVLLLHQVDAGSAPNCSSGGSEREGQPMRFLLLREEKRRRRRRRKEFLPRGGHEPDGVRGGHRPLGQVSARRRKKKEGEGRKKSTLLLSSSPSGKVPVEQDVCLQECMRRSVPASNRRKNVRS